MPMTFNCPCGEVLSAAMEHTGLEVECPTCGSRLRVPEQPGPSALPVAKPPDPPSKRNSVVDDDDDDDEPILMREPGKSRRNRHAHLGNAAEAHANKIMRRAHQRLDDEEEEEQQKHRGGLRFNPGILYGGISLTVGLLLLSVMVCTGFYWRILVMFTIAFILGGLIRLVLALLGQTTD